MKIIIKKIYIIAFLLLILPCFIFICGWLRLCYSIPIVIVLLIGTVHVCRTIIKSQKISNKVFLISKPLALMILLGTILIIWISGIGGGFPQAHDHIARNSIFRDLINQDWPVYYENTGRALTYYFGYWLPAAAVAKIFVVFWGEYIGWIAGNILLFIYSVIILNIIILLIISFVLKNKSDEKEITIKSKEVLLIFLVFVTWGGLDIIGQKISELLNIADPNNLNSALIEHYMNSVAIINCNMEQLMNVFNQTIPAFLATILFLNVREEYSCYGFIGFVLILYSPFALVGLGTLMIASYFEIVKKEGFKIKELLSISNCTSVIIVLIGLLFYNGGASTNFMIKNPFYEYGFLRAVFCIVVVLFVEYIGYSICIWHKNRTVLFYTANISIFVFFFIGIGSSADFTMRATIPAYFFIMLLVMRYLLNYKIEMGIAKIVILIWMLTIASISPFIDIMNLAKDISKHGTIFVQMDSQDVYTFSNKNGQSEYGILGQYTKFNIKNDIFYGILCNVKEQVSSVPQLEYEKKENEIYITKAILNQYTVDDFEKSIICTDNEMLDSKLSNIDDNQDHLVEFALNEITPSYNTIEDIENMKLNLTWNNVCHLYNQSNNSYILAEVEIANMGEQTLLPGRDKYNTGISVSLLDENGDLILNPLAFRYQEHIIYSSQREIFVLTIPRPEEPGKYKLKYTYFYEMIEDNEFIEIASTVYDVTFY